MNQSPEYLVVMTASIAPAPHRHNLRTDPKVRLSDYKSALHFWLNHPHPKLNKILFLENTGYDLTELKAIVETSNPWNKEVEFISMHKNDIPEGRHYGYGEMLMLDEGLSKSYLRMRTSHMIKATGRLVFPSIGRLVERLPEHFDIFVECRIPINAFKYDGNPLRVIRQRTKAYTSCQLMIFSHQFYEKELQKLYFNLSAQGPGCYPYLIENLLYDRIIQFEGQRGVYLRWPVNVEPAGFAGHGSKRYDSAGRRAISAIRAALRILAPEVWI